MKIDLENLSKVFTIDSGHSIRAVQDLNLTVEQGEFVVITGRSGSGKTTLLNLAAGLAKPTNGRVLLGDVDLWNLSDQAQSLLRNQKIGFIFQFPSLIPSLYVLENVALPRTFGLKSGKVDAYKRAKELLETVGLTDKLYAYPRQLSAGQQQRVVIARSLMNHPEVLMADEATSHLDEQTEKEIMALLKEVHAKTHVTIMMVAHSTDLIQYGTRSIKMANGMIVT